MREKENYRDMLLFLTAEKGAALMLSRVQAANLMGISRITVNSLIASGKLSVDKLTNKIPIGEIARYLC